MIRLIRLVGLATALFSTIGQAYNVLNQCNSTLYVASLHYKGGGTDGLNESGSWGSIETSGWKKLDPGGQMQLADNDRLRVEKDGYRVSANRIPSCIHPNQAFKYEIFYHDGTGAGRVTQPPPLECYSRGGLWVGFADHTSGDYFVTQAMCDAIPNAAQEQLRFQRFDSVSELLFIRDLQDWYLWDHSDSTNRGYKLRVLPPQSGYLIFEQTRGTDKLKYALKEGSFKMLSNNAPAWNDLGEGRFIQDNKSINVMNMGDTTLRSFSARDLGFRVVFQKKSQLISVNFGWTVDARTLGQVKPLEGHTDPALEQWAAYKLDQRFPFGRLLYSRPGQRWEAVQLNQQFQAGETVDFRINDTTLEDNGGFCGLAFKNVQ